MQAQQGGQKVRGKWRANVCVIKGIHSFLINSKGIFNEQLLEQPLGI